MKIATGKGELSMFWEESGGPPVSPPKHTSYGVRIIRNAVVSEFGGTANLAFQGAGVRCEISLPLEKVAAA